MKIAKINVRDAESEFLTKKITFMEDVASGVAHMREFAEDRNYLPKFPSESSEDYQTRLTISMFRPYTQNAIQSAIGKIFAKQLSIFELPEQFERFDILNNFDRDGHSIHEFAKELCEYQITHGVTFVYVAFPATNGKAVSISKEMRPYARIVRGDSIISKKYDTYNGKKILTQFVVSEIVNQDDGDYIQKKALRYRKIFINRGQIEYAIYKINGEGNEEVIETGVITIPKQTVPEIPLVACYGIKKGFMFGISPFEELGYLNIQHYQKSSDYDMSIHRCGAATPVLIGSLQNANSSKDRAVQNQTSVGGSEMLIIEQGGKFEWVSGSAQITPMREDIKDLESYIKGMSFEVMDGDNKTATQINDEKNDKEAKLKIIALNLESCLNTVIKHMCDYMNVDLGDGIVEINKDFNLAVMPIEDLQAYANLVTQNLMTKKTLYQEAQQGERLLTVQNIDDEIEMLTESI